MVPVEQSTLASVWRRHLCFRIWIAPVIEWSDWPLHFITHRNKICPDSQDALTDSVPSKLRGNAAYKSLTKKLYLPGTERTTGPELLLTGHGSFLPETCCHLYSYWVICDSKSSLISLNDLVFPHKFTFPVLWLLKFDSARILFLALSSKDFHVVI